MKRALLLISLSVSVLVAYSQDIRIMLVTGGHEYDSLEFFQMFDKMDDVQYDHFVQPAANRKIADDLAKDFDLIVFYDM